jgi:hypothetical protein
MRHTLAALVLSLLLCVRAQAAPAPEAKAASIAKMLAAACPPAAYNDEAAFRSCETAIRKLSLPFGPEVAWGGDQPDKHIRKRGLTHFSPRVFQDLYMPLFVFTGNWSVTTDRLDKVPVLRIEAYFRNALPSGDYPYPFWHSADKWSAYETANEVRFYLDPKGHIFVATRGDHGSEERRGTYAHVTPPAFTGQWQWTDSSGHLEPQASLFSNLYHADNPNLPRLEKAYRAFAMKARDATCLQCHTPANKAGAERLVLLQTPVHASGEIDNVIREIRNGEMPQDDIGLRADIDPKLRAAILRTALAFRQQLTLADQWERTHTH